MLPICLFLKLDKSVLLMAVGNKRVTETYYAYKSKVIQKV